MNMRSIALVALVAAFAGFHAAEAADKPSGQLIQSLKAKGLIAERAPAERLKLQKTLERLLKSNASALKAKGGSSTPWECLPGAGCWCYGENGPDCDALWTICDTAGGLWECSSDSGSGEDVCVCS
jgi:hypothetical protein